MMKNAMNRLKKSNVFIFIATVIVLSLSTVVTAFSQEKSELSVAEIMNAIIAPMTSTLWGAYDIQTEAQWQDLENAAYTVIAAGDLLKSSGANASNDDWQQYSAQVISAARMVLTAIGDKDEEALFNAGNDQLYPPCESCHQKYMGQ